MLNLLYERTPNERSQIEVESRNGLTSVHLVLGSLERNACNHTGSLNTLCRPTLTMACRKTVFQNFIKRMLHARKTLGWVIVLVVNMEQVVLNRLIRPL